MLILHGCVCASCPPDVEHSKTQRPQHSPPPALGPFLGADSKKSLHGRAGVSNAEKFGVIKRAQSCDAVGCQFKTAQLNVDVRCSEIPRFRLHRFSPAQVWITQHRRSARRSNGDLGGGVHLCLMDMTALGASHGPVLEAGAGRRNALDRRATLASRAAG